MPMYCFFGVVRATRLITAFNNPADQRAARLLIKMDSTYIYARGQLIGRRAERIEHAQEHDEKKSSYPGAGLFQVPPKYWQFSFFQIRLFSQEGHLKRVPCCRAAALDGRACPQAYILCGQTHDIFHRDRLRRSGILLSDVAYARNLPHLILICLDHTDNVYYQKSKPYHDLHYKYDQTRSTGKSSRSRLHRAND